MQHKKPAQTVPLLGPPCPICGANSNPDGSGGSTATCACGLTPTAEWTFGPNDEAEWYREAHGFSWRRLSAAQARMQHARDAAASVIVRRRRD